MTQPRDSLLMKRSFNAAELFAGHPPRLHHGHKRLLLDLAFPAGTAPAGTITYCRWAAMPLPASVPATSSTKFLSREHVYDYQKSSDLPGLEWHVNFADPHLFVAYAGGLFAQDEIQVAEHPILGSLLEALTAANDPALTVEGMRPTPITIRGAERRISVATDVNAAAERPAGLYGNRFAAASVSSVRRAVTVLNPPSITNLIAMAAPSGGYGIYKPAEIEFVLTTAFTGFSAARSETREALGDAAATVVHTGYWGCGAFGGNRTLMAALQLLAARLAQVDLLVFHTFDASGTKTFAQAAALLDKQMSGKTGTTNVQDLITQFLMMCFRWGVSDGN
jgi:hypothetical protein